MGARQTCTCGAWASHGASHGGLGSGLGRVWGERLRVRVGARRMTDGSAWDSGSGSGQGSG
eukprot:7307191-Prymnesium_polylepis.1